MIAVFPESFLEPSPVEHVGRPDDPRLGSLVDFSGRPADGCVLAIIGFPVDEGVRRNGGRVGASEAPTKIRDALYRMTPDARSASAFGRVVRRTVDLGDVVAGSLSDMQERLGELVGALLDAHVTPVVIGGGHETSFGHFLGYALASRAVSIVNFDAHLDVRPPLPEGGHSGSPFRQALEHPSAVCSSYTVVGLQAARNAGAHVEYALDRAGRILWSDEAASMRSMDSVFVNVDRGTGLMVSIDMDVVDAAFAPGVSAPTTFGLSPDVLRRAAVAAGASPAVTSFDVVEVNPKFDVDGRTVRLAASLIWSFMAGFAGRLE